MITGNLLETPFAQALEELEQADPRRRLQGLMGLQAIGDARALQVARSLMRDEDPEIRLEASRVVQKLRKDGVRERLLPGQETSRELVCIDSVNEYLDEVFFAISRNFGGVAWAAFRVGIPKLLLAGWFLRATSGWGGAQPLLMTGAFLCHQLFWRPLSWALTGRAVLAGFVDQASRRAGEIPLSGYQLIQLIGVNVRERVLLSPALCLIGIGLGSGDEGFLMTLGGGILAAFLLRLNPLGFPLQLMLGRAAGNTVTQAWDLSQTRSYVIGFAWSSFWAQLFGFYLLFGGTFLLLMEIFFRSSSMTFVSALLLADLIIDPFWIGYRLLTARMALNASPRAAG